MLKGIARLIDAYGESLKDDLFEEKLGVISIRELNRTARDRRAGPLGYAEAMILAYNARMKTGGLRWSALYSGTGRYCGDGDTPLEAILEDEQSGDEEDMYYAV